jgi:hypothetical protein
LHEFLVGRKPPSLIRQRQRDFVDSGKRSFKIASRDGLPVIGRIGWRKTILDVRMEHAGVYCADVTEWAASALEDAEQAEVVV